MNTMSHMIPVSRMIEAAFGPTFPATRTPNSEYTTIPRADIFEGSEEYRIVMDLPGVQNEDLDISLEDQTLMVKAERKLDLPEDFETLRSERASHTVYNRSFSLSNSVNVDKISAQLVDGELQLVLPKSQKSLPRRIEVK